MATKEQVQAARDALAIVDGASNGCGVSQALTRAYRAYLHSDGTDAANKAAPVKLILSQLCNLARIGDPLGLTEFGDLIDVCEDMVKESEEVRA